MKTFGWALGIMGALLTVVGVLMYASLRGKSAWRGPNPSQSPAPAAAQPATIADDDRFDLVDLIPGRVGDFYLYKAGTGSRRLARSERQVEGEYYLKTATHLAVTPGLRMTWDAQLSCFGEKPVGPICYGKRAKTYTIDGNEVCVSPDERIPAGERGSTDVWSAVASWTGRGECHLTFKRGLVGKDVSMEQAAGLAAEIAEWMKPILAGTADRGSLLENRRFLLESMKRSRESGGRAD